MKHKPNHTVVTLDRQAWVDIIADAIESTLKWADAKNGGSFRSSQIAEVVVQAITNAGNSPDGRLPKTRMEPQNWKYKN